VGRREREDGERRAPERNAKKENASDKQLHRAGAEASGQPALPADVGRGARQKPPPREIGQDQPHAAGHVEQDASRGMGAPRQALPSPDACGRGSQTEAVAHQLGRPMVADVAEHNRTARHSAAPSAHLACTREAAMYHASLQLCGAERNLARGSRWCSHGKVHGTRCLRAGDNLACVEGRAWGSQPSQTKSAQAPGHPILWLACLSILFCLTNFGRVGRRCEEVLNGAKLCLSHPSSPIQRIHQWAVDLHISLHHAA